jgi:hypothetical protein
MDNPLAMSDEDIINMEPPKVEVESSSVGSKTQIDASPDNKSGDLENIDDSATNNAAKVDVIENISQEPETESKKLVDNETTKPVDESPVLTDSSAKDADTPTSSDKSKESKEPEKVAASPDYKSFYEKIMIPFKANGKMIELKSPDEAIQLMQMGANYTRKMQELTPHRKVLMMLQNNGLMEESKLAFLIDLDRRNPEAIKKLVKDAGIDPLDIDTSKDSAYLVGNHKVTDEEVNFRTVLDDLGSTPEGKNTLQAIHVEWDKASKEVLWKSPELMATMHKQREVGIYQTIVNEMDRQKALGSLTQNTPFLEAYRSIGDQIMANGGFDPQSEKPKVGAVIDKRPAVAKPAATNGEKASAASSSRSTPKTANTLVNPLSIPDDEFMKQWANRV